MTHHRGDNGIFRYKEYMKDLYKTRHDIKFSGVGSQHQNGVVDRCIRKHVDSRRS